MSRTRVLSLCVFAFVASLNTCVAADRIVFARLGPSEATLFISNTDGSAERPLTQPRALDYDPSWSPRGDWIVFTSERAGSADLFAFIPTGQESNASPTIRRTTIRLRFLPMVHELSSSLPGPAEERISGFLTSQLTKSRRSPPEMAAISVLRGLLTAKWIAFSSDRDSDFPAAGARWERLHLVDIYLVHPDGTGLKRISQHGGFCGSPKWSPDSKAVITYCMSAQDTLTYRFGSEDGDNQLLKINVEKWRNDSRVGWSRRHAVPNDIDLRARSAIFAATKRPPESSIRAASRAQRDEISGLPPGPRMAHRSSTAVLSPGTPPNRRRYGAAIRTLKCTAPHGCPPTIPAESTSRSPR